MKSSIYGIWQYVSSRKVPRCHSCPYTFQLHNTLSDVVVERPVHIVQESVSEGVCEGCVKNIESHYDQEEGYKQMKSSLAGT